MRKVGMLAKLIFIFIF